MSLPTRWNPFHQISRFDPMNDLEELFRGFGGRSLARDYEKALEMRMDVTEDDKSYRVAIDIPGIKKEDIEVSIDGKQVTVSAEVKREKSKEDEKEIYSERYSGKALRTFTLPAEVDSATSEARYDGGVLTLVLSKKGNPEAKRLSVN